MKDIVISFLKKHPVIPSDSEISDKDSDLYDDIIDYLAKNMNDECVPLIIGSYRAKSSTYLSEVFKGILSKQNQTVVLENIVNALKSNDIKLKESGIFFAIEFASDDFVKPIIEILRDKKSTVELVNGAVNVLEILRKTEKETYIDQIIEKEFKQNTLWEKIVEARNKNDFFSSLMKINWEAKLALEKKEYKKVIELLGPYDGNLPKSAQKKLDSAKMWIGVTW